MRHVSAYSMFLGILIVAFSGNWIIDNYDLVSIYPEASYILFGIGLAIVVVTFIMNRISTYHEDTYVYRKDNRDALNMWLQDNRPFSKWLIGIIMIPLLFALFYSWSLFFHLFSLYLLCGFVLAGFVYILRGDRVEVEENWDYKGKTKIMLELIDYRKHPFNISLFLYILVIVSFVLSKQWDIPFYMETSGNPRYVTSLPNSAVLMSCLMVVSAFIYIISQGDFFGFRKAELSYDKVMFIHFVEIYCCGPVLLIWLFTVINALYAHFW